MFQPMGWLGITTGAGRKPPSVPIWIQSGPFVRLDRERRSAVSAVWFGSAWLDRDHLDLGAVGNSVTAARTPSHSTVPTAPAVVGVVLSAAT